MLCDDLKTNLTISLICWMGVSFCRKTLLISSQLILIRSSEHGADSSRPRLLNLIYKRGNPECAAKKYFTSRNTLDTGIYFYHAAQGLAQTVLIHVGIFQALKCALPAHHAGTQEGAPFHLPTSSTWAAAISTADSGPHKAR